MNLTGKELVAQGVITGDIPEENVQQHGVDCNLVGVRLMLGGGVVPAQGKTILTKYQSILPIEVNYLDDDQQHKVGYFWDLQPGCYDITLQQGCEIPSNQKMKLLHRSSIYRNGGMILSALWDAGFKTESMGTTLILKLPLKIEVGARVCQAHTYTSNEVENLYDGQYQGDAQRNDGREEEVK